jgi:hypothetical protein
VHQDVPTAVGSTKHSDNDDDNDSANSIQKMSSTWGKVHGNTMMRRAKYYNSAPHKISHISRNGQHKRLMEITAWEQCD